MLEPEKALDLYEVFHATELEWLTLHREYSQQYTTLVIAVLAGSLGALYQFGDQPGLALAVLAGPMLNILLCRNAISMCDRYYRRFLECVTIQAKLEPLFGLQQSRLSASETDPTLAIFPEDDQVLPARWLENRKRHQRAAEFVQECMRLGANRLVRLTMGILIVLNVMLILGILTSTAIALGSSP